MATKDTAAVLTIVGGVFYLIGGISGALVVSAFLEGLSAGASGATPTTNPFNLFGWDFFLFLAWASAAGILIIVGGVMMLSSDPARRKRGSYLAIAMMVVGAVPAIGGAVIGFILTLVGGIFGLSSGTEGAGSTGHAFPAANSGGTGPGSQRFCANCGVPLNPGAKFCSSCGQPLLSAPAGTPSQTAPWVTPVNGKETISWWWWLLPIFLVWVGGLVAYFVLRNRNEKTAKNILIFSIVWTVVVAVILSAVFFYLFAATFGHLSALGGGSPLVPVSGAITVPAGSGPAVIVMTVLNLGNSPVTGFTVTSVSPNVGGIVNNFTMTYGGKPLSHNATSSGNSLPVGYAGSGILVTNSANPMLANTTYTFTVTLYFQNGSTQTQTVNLTAKV